VKRKDKTYVIRGSNHKKAVQFSFPKDAVGPVSKTTVFTPPKTKLLRLDDFTESAEWAGDYDGAITFDEAIVLMKRTDSHRVIIHYAVEQTPEGEFQTMAREAGLIIARVRRDLKKLKKLTGKMEKIVVGP